MNKGHFVEKGALKEVGDYRILFQFGHLSWDFRTEADRKEFYDNEYYKGCMPAGFKVDSQGNYYLSVPRWNPGIPASFNRIIVKDGKPLLQPYPNWEMNEAGKPEMIQSVLGFEIDENDVLWILDQGRMCDASSVDGSQKIVKWDIKENKLLEVIKIPNEISSYDASFLNDICIDNENGFAYIADSGTGSDPLQGGLIVYNMKTGKLHRVLHQHESVQDVPNFWFEINGTKIWKDTPMRTGADGIALSHDRKTLYWCPLTGRNLYCMDTSLLMDGTVSERELEAAVVNLGSKGTNTDGMTADTKGRIWYSMLEDTGMGYYDPETKTMNPFISDPRMVWVDTPQLDNKGHLLFDSNQLHFLCKGELDYFKEDNLIIWQAKVEDGLKSYLFKE